MHWDCVQQFKLVKWDRLFKKLAVVADYVQLVLKAQQKELRRSEKGAFGLIKKDSC